MKTRKLGTTDMQFTTVGLGTWAIGGSWGPQDDRESIAAIQRAIDLGVTWIDTAAVYGLGHSEEVVGRAIKGRRDQVYIATKCGLVWDEGETSPYNRLQGDSVRREVENSLRRLEVDVIDLYEIHWPRPDADIEEALMESANEFYSDNAQGFHYFKEDFFDDTTPSGSIIEL